MNGDFRFDLNEVLKHIKASEVVCVYFPLLRKTMVVDVRTDVEDPPVVKLVPMVGSMEERIRSIRKLRPRFPQPERIAVIPWPAHVDSIVRIGIWETIVERCASTGDGNSVRACGSILHELRTLEKAEQAAAITGEQYHTIWQAPRG